MKASEVASELMKTPDAEVLLRIGHEWVGVQEVAATGQHRNAVTLIPTFPLPTCEGATVVNDEIT